MGVPGETVERRRELSRLSRRPIAALLSLSLVALLAYLYAPTRAPDVPAPLGRDCVELHLYSNGFHSDIGAPASIFPEDHPFRRMYPDAQSFLIGWGDQAFYYSPGTDLWLGLDALVPPSPSVFHIAYNAGPSSAYLSPTEDVPVAISHEGARRFVAFIDRFLVLDEDGNPIRTSDGKVIGRSAFLRSRGSFHLLQVCNQWMARALRAAGVNVNARAAWLAGPLVKQVRRTGRGGCSVVYPDA
ncbi:MAG: hypothetical protein A4S17_07045 [Proteobacteria bacterium HN_bin10]|jgi:uncharacterized protein (TIGR02117 family)|nr:MAG: hypothetical protein A4S17_07045 [Proteobacteria bacterium HN_bin10]